LRSCGARRQPDLHVDEAAVRTVRRRGGRAAVRRRGDGEPAARLRVDHAERLEEIVDLSCGTDSVSLSSSTFGVPLEVGDAVSDRRRTRPKVVVSE